MTHHLMGYAVEIAHALQGGVGTFLIQSTINFNIYFDTVEFF